MLATYLNLLELGYFELGEALTGLQDENLWQRPHPTCLSVGELAAHMAYAQAVRLAGEGRDLAKSKIQSPLLYQSLVYYPYIIESSPPAEALALTADQLRQETFRILKESTDYLRALNPDLDSLVPGLDGLTHEENLKYMVFHIAYHTGQIYSTRHLLGEQTPEN